MKSITDSAGERLTQLLAEVDAGPEQRVRFAAGEKGYNLVVDTESPDDKVFTHKERPVLIMSPVVAQQCEQRTLDFNEGRFQFT